VQRAHLASFIPPNRRYIIKFLDLSGVSIQHCLILPSLRDERKSRARQRRGCSKVRQYCCS
jgi:hypothetical protein